MSDSAHDAAIHASSNVPRRRRRKDQPGAKLASDSPRTPGPVLYPFGELPSYLQDNEFIQTGYRYDLPVKDTLRSFWTLHNESGNIWTHFLGFLLFVCITVWAVRTPPAPLVFAKPHLDQLWHSVRGNVQHLGENLQHSLPQLQSVQDVVQQLRGSLHTGVHSIHESVHTLQESLHGLQDSVQSQAASLAAGLTASPLVASLVAEGSAARAALALRQQLIVDAVRHLLLWPTARWPVYVFCAGAMSCLLLSTVCHLLGCCKQHISLMVWRFDYVGIALLIVASFYPPIYYGFMCQPGWAALYLSVITALGACCVAVSLLSRFQTPQWRATRAGMFAGLGLMGVIPVLHQLALNSHVWHVRAAVALIAIMGCTYLSGAGIYAARIPERWFPGKFDILLHSHQIFHLAVVLGAYVHWRAVLLLLQWRDASGGCAVPVTHGPLASVLAELRSLGHELMHVDQVWEGLRHAVADHLLSGYTMAGSGAASGLPAAVTESAVM
ncbi:hemolysin-III related-domain-containing protein [Haematococcus lacustris]